MIGSSARLRWRWYPVLHLVLFQVGWCACVGGAATGHGLLGPIVVCGCVLLHLGCVRGAVDELRVVAAACLLGCIADSFLGLLGLVRAAPFAQGVLAGVAPVWLVALWALLATTFHSYARWLLAAPGWAVLLGAVAGPVAYGAGARWGSVHFPRGETGGLLAVAAEWALGLPLLLWAARRWDGPAPAAPVLAPVIIARGILRG